MEKIGILDIGSNTVVLMICHLERSRPVVLERRSEAVHLASYEQNHRLSAEGLAKLRTVLKSYKDKLSSDHIRKYAAFITEPWRHIENPEELLDLVRSFGFPVSALSGEEEAELDYIGCRLDYPDVHSGNVLDIGGGSTELVSFRRDRVLAAVSIPLGCVRLSRYPLDTRRTWTALEKIRREQPRLGALKRPVVIGVGGTIRAAGRLYQASYGRTEIYEPARMQELYDQLKRWDPQTVERMLSVVNDSRIPVFLYGLHMMCDVLNIQQASKMVIAESCVREGFALKTFGRK